MKEGVGHLQVRPTRGDKAMITRTEIEVARDLEEAMRIGFDLAMDAAEIDRSRLWRNNAEVRAMIKATLKQLLSDNASLTCAHEMHPYAVDTDDDGQEWMTHKCGLCGHYRHTKDGGGGE